MTLAAPEWYHMRYKEGRAYPKSVYPSDKDYFAAIAKAIQNELQILYDNGLRNVQIGDSKFACKLIILASSSLILVTFPPSPDFFSEKCPKVGKRPRGHQNSRANPRRLHSFLRRLRQSSSHLPTHQTIHLPRLRPGRPEALVRSPRRHLLPRIRHPARRRVQTPEKLTQKQKLGFVRHHELVSGDGGFGEDEEQGVSGGRSVAEGNGLGREEALRRLEVCPWCGFASHSAGNAVKKGDMIGKLKLVRELADSNWPGEP